MQIFSSVDIILTKYMFNIDMFNIFVEKMLLNTYMSLGIWLIFDRLLMLIDFDQLILDQAVNI